jgi:hypothetical protein
MDKESIYGKGAVEYEEGSFQAITVGDGSTLFSSVKVDGYGFAAVGISCGEGDGVGVVRDIPENTLIGEVNPDLLLRFDNIESVDVLIGKLREIKIFLSS